MKKNEEKVLERILTGCQNLSEANKAYVLGLTEGMALVGGNSNEKRTRR